MVLPERLTRTLQQCWHCMARKKVPKRVVPDGMDSSHSYGLVRLVNVGLTSALPLGAYVIAGQTTKDAAGPSAVLSVFIASIASILSGLCFAELRSRVPRVKSNAYEYVFCILGEAAAFLTGWLIILQQLACSSATARAISQNFDSLLGNRILNLTITNIGRIELLDSQLDFVAFFIVLVTMIVNSVGIKHPSDLLTTVTNFSSVIVLCFVLVLSVFHLDFNNWQTEEDFFPHGAQGVFIGAACFFYAFTSFESMVTSVDFSPRAVRRPLALSTSVVFLGCLLLFMGVVSAMSLLSSLDVWQTESPLSETFSLAGLQWVSYLIAAVVVLCLIPVLLVHYTKMVSTMYAMASDGLLPALCHVMSDQSDTPILPVIILGVLGSFCSLVFSLTNLVFVVGLSSLAVFAISAIAVLSQRYRPSQVHVRNQQRRQEQRQKTRKRKRTRNPSGNTYGSTVADTPAQTPVEGTESEATLQVAGSPNHEQVQVSQEQMNGDLPHVDEDDADWPIDPMVGQSDPLPQTRGEDVGIDDVSSSDTDIDEIVQEYQVEAVSCAMANTRAFPSEATHNHALAAIATFTLSTIFLATMFTHAQTKLSEANVGCILLVLLLVATVISSAVYMILQPQDFTIPAILTVRVPAFPWLPLLTLFVNTHLAVQMSGQVWIQVILWMVLGILFYLGFGIKHSNQSQSYDHLPEEHRILLPSIPRHQVTSSHVNPVTVYDNEAATLRDDDVPLILAE